MAGSRTERYGTIFKRVQGMLKSGAMKHEDKPLWYDVYEAFPPKTLTNENEVRSIPQGFNKDPSPITNILYREDAVRAKFYRIFGNPEVVDLTTKTTTVCQKFIQQYTLLEQENKDLTEEIDESSLFDKTTELLKSRGVVLRSLEEIVHQKRNRNRRARVADLASGESVLNSLIAEMANEDQTEPALKDESATSDSDSMTSDSDSDESSDSDSDNKRS